MNNSTQAQKGFQTFVLTLSVSLIIFSIIYYFVTNMNTSPEVSRNVEEEVSEEAPVSFKKDDQPSVFKKLADGDTGEVAGTQEENPEENVLAGATTGEEESTQSTVPSSGVFSVTLGLFSSIMLFLIAGWIIKKGPRNLALLRFEQQFLDD